VEAIKDPYAGETPSALRKLTPPGKARSMEVLSRAEPTGSPPHMNSEC